MVNGNFISSLNPGREINAIWCADLGVDVVDTNRYGLFDVTPVGQYIASREVEDAPAACPQMLDKGMRSLAQFAVCELCPFGYARLSQNGTRQP